MESSLILCSQAGLATKGKKEQNIHSRGPHTQPKYVCPKTSSSWPYCCPPASLRPLMWELFVFQHHWDQAWELWELSLPFVPSEAVLDCSSRERCCTKLTNFSSCRHFPPSPVLPLCPAGPYLALTAPWASPSCAAWASSPVQTGEKSLVCWALLSLAN